MADLIFNIALGKDAYYATLPAANDSLILVPIETAGIVSDATMRDYDDLAAILAGASNEQTTIGRKTLTGVSSTVDDSGDVAVITADDVTVSTPTGNAISAWVLCYKPDTASADSAIVPLYKYDFTFTPAGATISVEIHPNGLARVAQAA